MRLGIRGLLLVVAVILFLLSAVVDDVSALDLLALGLAVFAGALLVDDLDIGGRWRRGGRGGL